MMGPRQVDQASLFYEFSLERHVPAGHLLRSIDRFVDLSALRRELVPFYSTTGRPSVDPELMLRMLIVGYCFGIRSERRLCDEVHLNLAYRWFCRLGLDGDVPDHSTFSKNRHGRFRDSDLLRRLFETVLERCIAEGLVGGEGFAVDGSLIRADASRQKGVDAADWTAPDLPRRPVEEYLAVLDDAAFGAATPVVPKFISPADPASRWTGADGGLAYFAHARRKLFEFAKVAKAPIAIEAVRKIDALFAIEREINGRTPAERLASRQTTLRPLVDALEIWLIAQRAKLSPKAELAKAISYSLKRWTALTRFVDDGRLCMTNNAAERALRGVAIGRANWTFAGSDRGAQRAAAIYTLTETCKLNGVDPQAWLADILARMPDHPARRIDDLLPWNWTPRRIALAA